MENYEKKYKLALNRIKVLIANVESGSKDCISIDDIQEVYPELKESEDERMKEAIIATIHLYYGEPLEDEAKEMIAWLEKQGEKEKFIKKELGCIQGYREEAIRRLHELEKQGEQPKKHDVCDNCDQQGSCVSPCPMKLVEKQGEKKPDSLETTARLLLDELSKSPYNNKPITDAQTIIKELLNFLKDSTSYNPNALNEQKPAEWSEEDDILRRRCMGAIQLSSTSKGVKKELVDWLKFLKDRVQPQPRQEWSEGDEEIRKSIIDRIERRRMSSIGSECAICENQINWLKSLSSQSHWKPSDEQMEVLQWCMPLWAEPKSKAILESLINDLKKLREE